MKRCIACSGLIASGSGSRCQACALNRGSWRQRAAFRDAVLSRDGYRCNDCGLVDPTGLNLEADHNTELRDGGTNDLSNGRTRCKACHRRKTNSRA